MTCKRILKYQVSSIKYQVSIILFIFVLILSLAGCAELRKKFIRKKKPVKTAPHYYQIERYDVIPSIELYTKHYVYWRSWHRELLELLGENTKKNKRIIQEMLGNLEDMKSMLVDEKADALERHIQVLRGIEKEIARGSLTLATKTRIRRTLEKESMLIKIGFSYRKMEPFIRNEFKREVDSSQ